MHSVQERLKTFYNWKHSGNCSAIRLSICGLYVSCQETQTLRCYICGIELEKWTGTEISYIEHRSKSPNCPLMNLQKKRNRICTHNNITNHKINCLTNKTNIDRENYQRNIKRIKIENNVDSYFRFKIKNDDDTYFCYKCGVTSLKHICKNYNFHKDLMQGSYDNEILILLNYKLILNIRTYDILYNMYNNTNVNKLKTVKEMIEKYAEDHIKGLKDNMDEDIGYINKLLE
ncbi:Baculovirus inhibitor of apoptosis like protein [Spraguea lophii 42_110]|uniref:Baculovirus inhibitor of apoptosis like protein n=1 Tax=Spraguea lophii (strain 42_110) TaxID=1358809 RepID=S7W8Y5_SPRLO|nr:Baculovirus inhibitor of apoptosis like protein [Spraguea lophii 42_110]